MESRTRAKEEREKIADISQEYKERSRGVDPMKGIVCGKNPWKDSHERELGNKS